MAARKKGPSKTGEEAGQDEQAVKKPTPIGPDLALTLPTAQGKPLDLSYWDLWFALAAVKDFGGDLDRLANHLGEKQTFVYRHLEEQRERLRQVIGDLTDEQLGSPSVSDPRQTVRRSILHGLHDEACHCGEIRLLLKMRRTAEG